MLRLPLIFGQLPLFYSIIHSLCVPSNELKQAVPSIFCVDHKHLKKLREHLNKLFDLTLTVALKWLMILVSAKYIIIYI